MMPATIVWIVLLTSASNALAFRRHHLPALIAGCGATSLWVWWLGRPAATFSRDVAMATIASYVGSAALGIWWYREPFGTNDVAGLALGLVAIALLLRA